jgi:hypothetical protein
MSYREYWTVSAWPYVAGTVLAVALVILAIALI